MIRRSARGPIVPKTTKKLHRAGMKNVMVLCDNQVK